MFVPRPWKYSSAFFRSCGKSFPPSEAAALPGEGLTLERLTTWPFRISGGSSSRVQEWLGRGRIPLSGARELPHLAGS